MRKISLNIPSQLYIAVAFMTFVFLGSRLNVFLGVRRDLTQAAKKINAMGPQIDSKNIPGAGNSGGLEGLLSACAKENNLKKLLSVGTKDNLDSQEIHLDWEANQYSTVRFLNEAKSRGLIGPCIKLQLSSIGQGGASLRGTGVFQPGHPSDKKEIPPSPPTQTRDVFVQLWALPLTDQLTAAIQHDQKKEEETRAKEQERQLQEQKVREAAEKIESQKRLLEAMTVAGIAHNGHEALAFITTGASGQTTTVRMGDTIQDAQVTLIDEKRGEVHLDCPGKFQVVLKLNSQTGKF